MVLAAVISDTNEDAIKILAIATIQHVNKSLSQPLAHDVDLVSLKVQWREVSNDRNGWVSTNITRKKGFR